MCWMYMEVKFQVYVFTNGKKKCLVYTNTCILNFENIIWYSLLAVNTTSTESKKLSYDINIAIGPRNY